MCAIAFTVYLYRSSQIRKSLGISDQIAKKSRKVCDGPAREAALDYMLSSESSAWRILRFTSYNERLSALAVLPVSSARSLSLNQFARPPIALPLLRFIPRRSCSATRGSPATGNPAPNPLSAASSLRVSAAENTGNCRSSPREARSSTKSCRWESM